MVFQYLSIILFLYILPVALLVQEMNGYCLFWRSCKCCIQMPLYLVQLKYITLWYLQFPKISYALLLHYTLGHSTFIQFSNCANGIQSLPGSESITQGSLQILAMLSWSSISGLSPNKPNCCSKFCGYRTSCLIIFNLSVPPSEMSAGLSVKASTIPFDSPDLYTIL